MSHVIPPATELIVAGQLQVVCRRGQPVPAHEPQGAPPDGGSARPALDHRVARNAAHVDAPPISSQRNAREPNRPEPPGRIVSPGYEAGTNGRPYPSHRQSTGNGSRASM